MSFAWFNRNCAIFPVISFLDLSAAVVVVLPGGILEFNAHFGSSVFRGGPTNLDKNRGWDKWNSAGYAAAASG